MNFICKCGEYKGLKFRGITCNQCGSGIELRKLEFFKSLHVFKSKFDAFCDKISKCFSEFEKSFYAATTLTTDSKPISGFVQLFNSVKPRFNNTFETKIALMNKVTPVNTHKFLSKEQTIIICKPLNIKNLELEDFLKAAVQTLWQSCNYADDYVELQMKYVMLFKPPTTTSANNFEKLFLDLVNCTKFKTSELGEYEVNYIKFVEKLRKES